MSSEKSGNRTPLTLDGFARRRVNVGETEIDAIIGGAELAAAPLHDYPQTRAMWRRVAPQLAERYTAAADLRGYDDSGKPAAAPDHAPYAKRRRSGSICNPAMLYAMCEDYRAPPLDAAHDAAAGRRIA